MKQPNFTETTLGMMVMESNMKANEIIDYIKDAIRAGIDPNTLDIDYSDVLSDDMIMIETEINAFLINGSY